MATKKEKQAFQSDVASAVKSYEKTIKEAQKTIAMAEKSGTAKQLTKAQGFLKDLQDLQPIIDKLKQAKSPTATYGGPITQSLADQLNRDIQSQAMGAVARGEYGAANNQRFIYAKEADVPGFEGYMADQYWISTGGTGTSNTGKYYYKGKLVENRDKWISLVSQDPNKEEILAGEGESVVSETGSSTFSGSSFYNTGQATGSSTSISGNYSVSSTGRSTNLDVLKSILRGMGFNASIVDSSSSFLLSLLKDGLDYDNAVEIFLNSKDYTTKEGKKLDSPFYSEYGYLNEGLVKPKGAAELYNAVEGYKEVRATFNLNEKFISRDFLKDYVKNNVSVAAFSQNANLARLKAVNADAAFTDSLKRFGYITADADLTDFFLDPKVGEETLNQRKASAAFGAEAIRRAKQGIEFSTTRFNQITAGLLGLGLSPEQIQVKAAEGLQNIADVLLPTTKLTQIYEKPDIKEEALRSQVQQELEAEEYTGLLSERRKRAKELETRAYQAQAGIYRGGALRKPSTAGTI